MPNLFDREAQKPGPRGRSFLAELGFDSLSIDLRRAARGHLLDEREVSRVFESGQSVVQEPAEVSQRQGVVALDDGFPDLSPLVVGDRDHDDFLDIGMVGDGVLYFGRVDVLAAADVHLLFAALDVVVTVGVLAGEVAGRDERPEGRSGLLGIVEIAGGGVG
jgi:hypothetical protein